jgi:hypothetical protein
MAESYPPRDPRGPQFDADPTPSEGGESANDELLERFGKWATLLDGHWSKWIEEAKIAYDFVSGTQWTEGERSEMEAAGKIPVTFNLIDPVLSAVQGAEIQNRQQVQFYPREVGDTGVSDVLTQAADYVSDECSGDMEDSEAFWDTLVCGLGWTETRPEIEGDQVSLVKERVDPLQIQADPSARKRCLEDMRYLRRKIPMSEDEFEDFKDEIGRPDIDDLDGVDPDGKRVTIVNPQVRYTHGMLGDDPTEASVIVCEWQWWDRETVYLAGMPDAQTGVVQITPLDAESLQVALQNDPYLKYSKSHKKVYYRAFATDGEILFKETLGENSFRYKPITGKRERNTGTWFGLVRPMLDPGRFVNKLYSEILHIIRTNANGGMALEEDAVEDVRQFESTWAATDKITWLKSGSLSGQHGSKMMPKSPPPVQAALFNLMEFAKDMVKATTGVNEEILGLVGREQAGVLEQQRKSAAYGILSAFFDAKRRYQREQGKLLLAQMRIYFPADKLARITDKGTAQYVPIAASLESQEYDIVVDEAPAGPDQKAKVMAVLMPLIPQLLEAGLIDATFIADVVQYLPIPAAIANKLSQAITQKQQAAATPDPVQQAMGQAELQNKQADTAKKGADAQLSRARAFKETTQAHGEHLNLIGASAMLPPPAGGNTNQPQQQAPQPGAPGGPGLDQPPPVTAPPHDSGPAAAFGDVPPPRAPGGPPAQGPQQ